VIDLVSLVAPVVLQLIDGALELVLLLRECLLDLFSLLVQEVDLVVPESFLLVELRLKLEVLSFCFVELRLFVRKLSLED